MPVVLSSCPSQLDTQVEPGISTGAAPTECLHRRARSRRTRILCPSSSYLPATHFRISAGLPRSSCLSIAKLFNLLFSALLQRPSSQLYGYHIIVYQRRRATRPPAQYGARNDNECPVKRDGSVRVESCRVKLNTKLVGLGRSWLVLNIELVELQVLKLASSFSHYQYI